MNVKLYQERSSAALSGESRSTSLLATPRELYCWRRVEQGLSHYALMHGKLMINRLQLILACIFVLPVLASTFAQEEES